ncbi:MAG: hypothetical protein ACYS1A_05940 [Planctomycetota bacterium]|jgi:hypothetical protein
MKAIYKKYSKKVILIWAGYLLLPFLVYLSALAPQKKHRKDIERQLTEKKQIHDSAVKAAQQGTKMRLNEQLKQLQKDLSGFVINFEDSADLTFDISQIAGEKKVGDFGIKTKDKKNVTAIPNCNYICENHVDINFTADFNKFAALLNALERHWPVVFIDKFAITRSTQDDLNHPVIMNLTVFVKTKQET